MPSPSVAVVGAAGFAGAIAARILHRHPGFALVAATARGDDLGLRLDSLYPHHRVPLALTALEDLPAVDAALVAYPHGAAAPVVAGLRERGVRVVDLSADFRLRDPAVYAEWYGEHAAPALFGTAAYGLPELHREEIAGADLVAGPGCYPTAAILALAPLRGRIGELVIDAKSGISGAGRAATASTHFVSADENLTPYKVGGHRHTPEIEQELGVEGLLFVPHLVPLDQGELVSAYVTPSSRLTAGELAELYRAAYAEEPFVELAETPPGVRDVRETNVARLHVRLDERTGKILAFAAIDNLWKGAASQGVQALNLMFGRPETEGLAP